MHYQMELKQFPDYDDPIRIGAQILSWDYGGFKGKFRVSNLSDCPEDAIIGRGLFDAWDFIHAVEFGMDLARKGYTGIEVEEIVVKDEDEDV